MRQPYDNDSAGYVFQFVMVLLALYGLYILLTWQVPEYVRFY